MTCDDALDAERAAEVAAIEVSEMWVGTHCVLCRVDVQIPSVRNCVLAVVQDAGSLPPQLHEARLFQKSSILGAGEA